MGTDDKVKKEYRSAWKKLASTEKILHMIYIMQQIVKEMKESDWKSIEESREARSITIFMMLWVLPKEGNFQLFSLEGLTQESQIRSGCQ